MGIVLIKVKGIMPFQLVEEFYSFFNTQKKKNNNNKNPNSLNWKNQMSTSGTKPEFLIRSKAILIGVKSNFDRESNAKTTFLFYNYRGSFNKPLN